MKKVGEQLEANAAATPRLGDRHAELTGVRTLRLLVPVKIKHADDLLARLGDQQNASGTPSDLLNETALLAERRGTVTSEYHGQSLADEVCHEPLDLLRVGIDSFPNRHTRRHK